MAEVEEGGASLSGVGVWMLGVISVEFCGCV